MSSVATTGVIAQAGLRIVGLGASLIAVSALTRALGAQNYGIVAIGIACANLAFNASDGGLNATASRLIVQAANTSQTVISLAVVRGVILFIASVGVITWALMTHQGNLRVVLLCLLSVVPYLGTTYRVVVEAQVRPVLIGLIHVSQSVAWVVLVVVLTFFRAGAELFAAAFIVAVGVQAVTAYAVQRRCQSNRTRDSTSVESDAGMPVTAMKIFRAARPLMIGGVVVTCYFRGIPLLAASLVNSIALSQFLLAYRLLDAAQILPMSLSSTLLPMMSRARRNGDVILWRKHLTEAFLFAATLGLGALGVVFFFGDQVLELLGGSEFESGKHVLTLIFLAYPLICVGYVLSTAITASGHVRNMPASAALSALVGASVAVAVAHNTSVSGIVYSMIGFELTSCLSMTFILIKSRRHCGREDELV